MLEPIDPYRLGASLYVPASRPRLGDIVTGTLVPDARSVIVCTEDAIDASDLAEALVNLGTALVGLRRDPARLRFVRVRDKDVMAWVLDQPAAEAIDGFVLPKITPIGLTEYFQLIERDGRPFHLMPTLETRALFDDGLIAELRAALMEPRVHRHILALRVGGNDLLNLLGWRRQRGATIWDGPLASVISRLLTAFLPDNFAMTSAVFDGLDDLETLAREAELDFDYGFVGKSAVHPSQIPVIENLFRVSIEDADLAAAILTDSRAVFRAKGVMCEPVTQRRWAERVSARLRVFGLRHSGTVVDLVSSTGTIAAARQAARSLK